MDASALPAQLFSPPPRMPAVPIITADAYTADDEDSRGAFSSDIDPATLGPPPEWVRVRVRLGLGLGLGLGLANP